MISYLQDSLILRYVITRAIDLGESYYTHDGLIIDKDLTDELDAFSGTLFDLVDEHWDARDRNDLDASNDALDKVLSDPLLRILSAYWFNSSVNLGEDA